VPDLAFYVLACLSPVYRQVEQTGSAFYACLSPVYRQVEQTGSAFYVQRSKLQSLNEVDRLFSNSLFPVPGGEEGLVQ
jgi:hypothetical protein